MHFTPYTVEFIESSIISSTKVQQPLPDCVNHYLLLSLESLQMAMNPNITALPALDQKSFFSKLISDFSPDRNVKFVKVVHYINPSTSFVSCESLALPKNNHVPTLAQHKTETQVSEKQNKTLQRDLYQDLSRNILLFKRESLEQITVQY